MQQDGAAVCTHTWVDDGDVDRIIWEVTIADAQDEGSLGDVLGSYLVGEVDEAQRRVDAEGDTLHHAGVGVGQPEIRSEYQQRPVHPAKRRAGETWQSGAGWERWDGVVTAVRRLWI